MDESLTNQHLNVPNTLKNGFVVVSRRFVDNNNDRPRRDRFSCTIMKAVFKTICRVRLGSGEIRYIANRVQNVRSCQALHGFFHSSLRTRSNFCRGKKIKLKNPKTENQLRTQTVFRSTKKARHEPVNTETPRMFYVRSFINLLLKRLTGRCRECGGEK